MVRRKQQNTSATNLDELESNLENDISLLLDEKQLYRKKKRLESEKSIDSEMETTYYFSVVFDNTEQRNEWLTKHNLDKKLKCHYYILAEDFNL